MALSETIKGLARHTGVYSLGWIAGSIIGILMLPVYTRFLSKADYGIIEIITQASGVLRILLLSGFNYSVAKFYHDAETALQRKRVISTVASSVVVIGAVGCGLIILSENQLGVLLFGRSDASSFVRVGALILYCDLLFFVFSMHLFLEKQSRLYVVLGFVKLFVGVGGNLLFIVYLHLGAMGMLYGNLVSYAIVAAIAAVNSIGKNGLGFDKVLAGRMLAYGLPMVLSSLCGAVMHNADRFLILKYCSVEDVGMYGLGYNFPMMLNALLLSSFNLVWGGSVLFEISRQEDASYQYGRITTYFITLFVFLQMSLAVSSTSLLKILAAPKFFGAHQVIPYVALGLSFHAFYTFFTAGAFLKAKTSRLILAYLPAACCNVVLNVILLPQFGYIAAAWVSLITYGVFALLAYCACKSILSIAFEFRRLAFVYLAAISCYALSRVTYMDRLWLDMTIQVFILLLFLGGLLFGPFLTQGEKAVVLGRVFALRALLRASASHSQK